MIAATLATRAALADPLADLEKAHTAYVAHKYDDAEARLRALLDAKTGGLKDPDSIADARMYLGAVLVEERRKEEADTVFEKLLLDKPLYTPDQLRVSSEAINAFLDTQTRLRDLLRKKQDEQAKAEAARRAQAELARHKAAMRLAMLEALASEERVVERHSRWTALVPFGVGQFQNGRNDLGWAFLSTETLLAVGSAVGAVVSAYEAGQASSAYLGGDAKAADAFHTNAYNAYVAADVLAGGFVLAAAIGALQAELAFVPESVHIRKRPLPPLSLAVTPTGVSLAGRF